MDPRLIDKDFDRNNKYSIPYFWGTLGIIYNDKFVKASEMLANNKHLHYVVPREGSNLWFDNLVIPKTAKHFKAIYAFLNFMMEPKNAAQNAEYVGYATPNAAAKKLLPKSVQNDRQFYPDDETMKHLEIYSDLPPAKVGLYNDLFLEFKMYRR